MNDNNVNASMIINQLEDALEERQNSDRRKVREGLPPGVEAERRKGDRRTDSEVNED